MAYMHMQSQMYVWSEHQFKSFAGKEWTEMEVTSIEEIRDENEEAAADQILSEVDHDAKVAVALRQFQAAYRVAVRNKDPLPQTFTDAYDFSNSIT